MQPYDEVKLALSPQVLERLLAEHRISICDFRCLDARTKQRIHRMFLTNTKAHLTGC